MKASPLPATQSTQAEMTAVSPAVDDFLQTQADETVSISNLDELNRTARARGWIRDVFFAYDSYRIDAAGRDALNASAAWLNSNLSYRLRIEGHCDDRGTEQYNLALGEQRANVVRDYLIQAGVEPDRMSTISYGEERPFATGGDERAWSQNRRAHLRIESPLRLGAARERE